MTHELEAPVGAEPPSIARARQALERVAISDAAGQHRYRDLLATSERIARELLRITGRSDLGGTPVAHLSPRGFRYVVHQWGIWRAGGMAVPLALSHPAEELAYVLDDADPVAVLADGSLADRVESLAAERSVPMVGELPGDGAAPDALPPVDEDRPALMLYTSGTTGRPKGVVHTHRSLRAQAETLVDAWEWRSDDRILLVLPLHHLHGLMNVLGCALWSGARCDVLPGFDPEAVWERLATGELTLFMAVPTIYHRLIAAWEAAGDARREQWSSGARAARLMVSGSAALPVPVLERWREITGHTLLERYGMTEIGMALSNPLRGERRPGHVGRPLPGVELRLVDDDGRVVSGDGSEGEIQVRGPMLFRKYWRRPEATRDAFTEDGWFRTGDLARIDGGHYRILGRRSVDILKSGGFKISALEIEAVLRRHPAVDACAVVGVPDPEWGERVAAAIVARPDQRPIDHDALRRWAKERLAPYKVPTLVRWVDALPRNAVGKVTKPRVRELFLGA